MAITFPLNPSNGDTHIENGITFEYNSTSGSWKKQISVGTLEASASTFSVTSAVTEEFNRTLGSGVSTDLTLSNDHNDKALVHAKKFIPGDDVTDINWDFDTTDESQWNFLSDKIEFVDGKVLLWWELDDAFGRKYLGIEWQCVLVVGCSEQPAFVVEYCTCL